MTIRDDAKPRRQIDRMYAQCTKDQLHIHEYLSANCFGDYLTRTGIDLQTRELLTLSMLAALGGCEPQLAGTSPRTWQSATTARC